MFQLKTRSKLLTVVGAAFLALALLVPVAQAKEELGANYKQYAGCQSEEENASISTCVRSEINGGHFQMGSKTVPITQPITVTGGVNAEGEGFTWNSQGGLSLAKQTVPGGVVGLTGLDWLYDLLSADALKLYAVTELAGTPSSPLLDPISLPIKVHLINPILGNNCYVGSNTNPINLSLTFGTTAPPPPNEPISGQIANFEYDEATEIVHLEDGILVDNAFAAPAAKGCVLNLGILPVNIDALVNLQAGLPSAAGTNETVQNIDAEIVERARAYQP